MLPLSEIILNSIQVLNSSVFYVSLDTDLLIKSHIPIMDGVINFKDMIVSLFEDTSRSCQYQSA